MPIFSGKNGLDYMDNLYNAISKASAYYIPDLKEEGKAFNGQKIEATLRLKDKDEAAHAALLFSAAGAESLADGYDLKITGDLGAILAAGRVLIAVATIATTAVAAVTIPILRATAPHRLAGF